MTKLPDNQLATVCTKYALLAETATRMSGNMPSVGMHGTLENVYLVADILNIDRVDDLGIVLLDGQVNFGVLEAGNRLQVFLKRQSDLLNEARSKKGCQQHDFASTRSRIAFE